MSVRAAAKVCSTCRHTYRGSFAVHAATASHRTAARRASGDTRGPIGKTGKRAIRAAAAGRARRSESLFLERSTVKVKRYKRSRPNDGRAKVVGVVRHYRHKPDTYRELHESRDGSPYFLIRSGKTHAALSVRSTSARAADKFRRRFA